MPFKLLLPFSIAALSHNQTVIAQTSLDTSYRTTYYVQKITMFNLQPDTKKEVIFLGDSITDIAEWAEIWRNKKIRNRGISSDNTFGVLARLDEVLSSRPAKIFIMIGINDIARGTPDSIIIANYQKIIQNIRTASPDTKLYVQSILPTNNTFSEFKRHQNKDEHISFINTALQKLATGNNLFYVDLHNAFINTEGKLNTLYTNDGLHINGAGYMKWKEKLIQKEYMK